MMDNLIDKKVNELVEKLSKVSSGDVDFVPIFRRELRSAFLEIYQDHWLQLGEHRHLQRQVDELQARGTEMAMERQRRGNLLKAIYENCWENGRAPISYYTEEIRKELGL